MSTKLVKKDSEFAEVLGIIRAGRAKAYKAVNVALIDTYWAVGAHLSSRVAEGGWGKGVVRELSDWLLRQAPDLKGFSASNLWRMKQFYDVYADQPKLAALLRVLPWTHNLMILGQNKRPEEREFYLRLAVKAKWSSRELAHQIKTAAFERTVLSDKKLAALPRLLPQDATGVFKDSYLLDFLDLPQRHSEAELQTSLLRNLRKFLMELGDGFSRTAGSGGGGGRARGCRGFEGTHAVSGGRRRGRVRGRILREAEAGGGGEEFVVAVFVEPGALDVEELETGNEAREGEGIDGELRDWLVGAGVGLVVEDMDRAIADLQKVDMSGDRDASPGSAAWGAPDERFFGAMAIRISLRARRCRVRQARWEFRRQQSRCRWPA